MLNGTAYDGNCKSMSPGAYYDSKLWGIGRIKGVKERKKKREGQGRDDNALALSFHNE
jgi:hypothetical protein